MTDIRLVGVGTTEGDVLEFLALTLRDNLPYRSIIERSTIDAGEAFEPSRGQYHSTRLIAKLLALTPPDSSSKVLGVTDLDLFIPILTFVFGEAQLGGRVALVSTHRLRQEFYGLPQDQRVFLERVEKEALHELGHTLGLVHCRVPECVMGFSNAVENVDLKSNSYCDECRSNARLDSTRPARRSMSGSD